MINSSSEEFATAGFYPFARWIEAQGVSQVTGWRWRNRKWIEAVDISGRWYVTPAGVERFQERAARGEFAKAIRPPSGKSR
jgi:hypothetical protein